MVKDALDNPAQANTCRCHFRLFVVSYPVARYNTVHDSAIMKKDTGHF